MSRVSEAREIIERLRDEAGEAGDLAQVALCDAALWSRDPKKRTRALNACLAVVAAAAAAAGDRAS